MQVLASGPRGGLHSDAPGASRRDTHRQDHGNQQWGGRGPREGCCHSAGPTPVPTHLVPWPPKAREKQRLGKISPGPRSPPCGGRLKPRLQGRRAHHAPSLKAETYDLGTCLGGETVKNRVLDYGFARIFVGWLEIS